MFRPNSRRFGMTQQQQATVSSFSWEITSVRNVILFAPPCFSFLYIYNYIPETHIHTHTYMKNSLYIATTKIFLKHYFYYQPKTPSKTKYHIYKNIPSIAYPKKSVKKKITFVHTEKRNKTYIIHLLQKPDCCSEEVSLWSHHRFFFVFI